MTGAVFPDTCTMTLVGVVHYVAAVAHLLVTVTLWVLRSQFVDHILFEGKLPLTCTVPSNVTTAESESLRAFSPVELDSPCGVYDLVLACIVLHGLTMGAHVWYAVKGTSNGWRWVEYFFSAPLVFLHTALTSGTRDVGTLVLIATSSAGVMPLGHLIEQRTVVPPGVEPSASQKRTNAQVTSLIVGWVVVVGVQGTILLNFGRLAGGAPTFVIGIVAAEMVLLPLFGVVAMFHSSVSASTCDVLHTVLSFSSKIVPTAVFISSITK